MRLYAPAKLNLFLRVLRKRPDGYHELETLFQKITLCDEVELRKATDIALEVKGEAPPGRENLCFRAAEAFLSRAAIRAGVFIRLRKRIPAGTGLGGASSDAAAVLRGLSALYPGHLSQAELFSLARTLGADVPFFLSPYATAFARGIGDELSPFPETPAWYLVVVPPFRVSTRWAYQNLRLTKEKTPLNYGPKAPEGALNFEGVLENDFRAVVFERYPELYELERALLSAGAKACGLSGSGSALFGVFAEEEAARRAEAGLVTRFPAYAFYVVTNYKEGTPCSSIT